MQYQEYKDGIASRLNSVAEDFFTVGYYLRKISDSALFLEDGYKSIWEFAKGEYNLSMSSASRFMAINARFSVDDGEHMGQKYIGMGVSKLQEMLGLPDEELEKVTKETTVREIRAIKAALKPAPLSFYNLPKTVRPEGSLLTTPGCGDGKYSCFSCCRECAIRQEPRQCRTAPLGNPRPCDRVNNEEWKKSISYSLYRNECQLLHPELAPIREGDKEPAPCCLTCKNRASCYSCCDVAKKAYEDEVKAKARQAEERKRLREREAKKPEPTPEEIKLLYEYWNIDGVADITAEALKAKHNYSGGGGGKLKDYNCTSRGVRINYKRELTWARIAKEFKEIRKDAGKTEKQCLIDFYKEIYPSTRAIIKNRNAAEITKTFKTEYGSMYENGKGFSCYPDKVVLDPAGTKRQITWGKLTTKLLALLDEKPELEGKALTADAPKPAPKEPEIIDAEFIEIKDEAEQEPAQDGQNPAEADAVEEITAEAENGQQEAPVALEDGPEVYRAMDVSLLLIDCKRDLKAYKDASCPDAMIRKQKILVDALTLLESQMEKDGGEEI